MCVCVRTREGAVGALASVFLDPLLTSIAPTRSFSSDDEAFFLTDSSLSPLLRSDKIYRSRILIYPFGPYCRNLPSLYGSPTHTHNIINYIVYEFY